jgi:hypothetical protein
MTAPQPTGLPPAAQLEFIKQRVVSLLGRVGVGIVQIGIELHTAKTLLPHGEFSAWVEQHLQVSTRTAERFMAVAGRFADKADRVSHLPAGVLYELASPSTPDEVVERVLAGHLAPTVRAINDAKADANSRSRPAEWIERKARTVLAAFDGLTAAVDHDDDAIVSYLVIAACERYEDPSEWLQSLADFACGAAQVVTE